MTTYARTLCACIVLGACGPVPSDDASTTGSGTSSTGGSTPTTTSTSAASTDTSTGGDCPGTSHCVDGCPVNLASDCVSAEALCLAWGLPADDCVSMRQNCEAAGAEQNDIETCAALGRVAALSDLCGDREALAAECSCLLACTDEGSTTGTSTTGDACECKPGTCDCTVGNAQFCAEVDALCKSLGLGADCRDIAGAECLNNGNACATCFVLEDTCRSKIADSSVCDGAEKACNGFRCDPSDACPAPLCDPNTCHVDHDFTNDCDAAEALCLHWSLPPRLCESFADRCSDVRPTTEEVCESLRMWVDKVVPECSDLGAFEKDCHCLLGCTAGLPAT